MNQQGRRTRRKYLSKRCRADPKFAVARLKSGRLADGPAELEPARRRWKRRRRSYRRIPMPGTTWGWCTKIWERRRKASELFSAWRKITNEADAYYFLGYLNTSNKNTMKLLPHFRRGWRSALIMLRRNSDWRGRSSEKAIPLRRKNIWRVFRKSRGTSGAPFGAGYGDQGRYSLAELPRSTVVDVPAAIPVRYWPQPDAFVSKATGGDGAAIGPSTGRACSIMTAIANPIFSL